jgi:hypothetical protein
MLPRLPTTVTRSVGQSARDRGWSGCLLSLGWEMAFPATSTAAATNKPNATDQHSQRMTLPFQTSKAVEQKTTKLAKALRAIPELCGLP